MGLYYLLIVMLLVYFFLDKLEKKTYLQMKRRISEQGSIALIEIAASLRKLPSVLKRRRRTGGGKRIKRIDFAY